MMRRFSSLVHSRVPAMLALPVLLAGCGDSGEGAFLPPERDPIAVQAVNDQIMTDPDLSARNEANAALTTSTDHSIPPVVGTREAISSAQQEALELIKGTGAIPALPDDIEEGDALNVEAGIGLQGMAALTPEFAPCAGGLGYTARWAAEWPAIMPIYPRANLRESAGNTAGGCALRSASLLTPVAYKDVAAFYLEKARTEGLRASIRQLGPAYVVSAAGRGVEARVYIAPTAYGQTRLDIVLQGGD
ncbi:hypothetical protein ACFCW2_00850 [Qipengyuania sp. DSG2-2]|uniref:hypothetical protein n=1 Tax=Qipengyuania sp. DGS2-2 TaxID=3349631 RepID=UPI0036D38EF1